MAAPFSKSVKAAWWPVGFCRCRGRRTRQPPSRCQGPDEHIEPAHARPLSPSSDAAPYPAAQGVGFGVPPQHLVPERQDAGIESMVTKRETG